MRDFESSSESLRLILEKGNISHIENGGEKLQKILFQKYDFPVTQGSFRPHFQVKPSMMDSGQLWGIMTMESAEALKLGFDKNYIEKIKFEFWNRINTPFLCMIFTFLGVSIGVQDNRGKKKNVGSMSLFFLVVYYSIFFALVTLSRSTILPAFMAVFIPTIMTFFYSLNHYKKLNWFGN